MDTSLLNGFMSGLSSTIVAVLLLLLAFVAAAVARAVVNKLLGSLFQKSFRDAPEESKAQTDSLISILGNVVFAIIFLLFLPGALEKLGMSSVVAPISSMAGKFIGYLPNLIAALLIIIFGAFLAKLVRQILTLALKKTKIDSLQEKAGIQPTAGSALSDILASLAYALVLIVFVVAALQALQLDAISDPATAMVGEVFAYIPQIFAAIILTAFGVFLANIVSRLLGNVLKDSGIDKTAEGLFPTKEDGTPVTTASELIGIIVRVVIDIFFVVAAINVLNITVLTAIGTTIIAYLPNVLAAVIVVLGAWILSDKAQQAILRANAQSVGLAMTAKALILTLAAFMALTQLGIAETIVTNLFTIAVIGLATAFAISFGIGGRDFAKRKLDEIDARVKDELKRDA